MMDKVLISVIIPVYNAGHTLKTCMDSVLCQPIRQIEVICVDDGSTDESRQILRDYAHRDDRVTVICQPNLYAGTARNRGIEKARGTYVAFLDADDAYLPGSLNYLYEKAEKYRLDVVKSGFEYLDSGTGARFRTLYSGNSSISLFRRGRVIKFRDCPARLLNIPDVPWNGLYRRDFLNANGIRFNALRCINDHSFFIACLLHAERMMVLPRAVVRYRVAQEGSLIRIKADHFETQLSSFAIVKELCQSLSPELRRQIMGQELNGVFGWYQRLKVQADDAQRIELQLASFLKQLDEELVGEVFLREFPYSGEYYRLRYGCPAPGRGHAAKRAVQCWREHGTAYTLARLLRSTERGWKL